MRPFVVLAVYLAVIVGGFVGMVHAYPAQSEVAQNIFLWAPWFPALLIVAIVTLPLSMRWANDEHRPLRRTITG